MKKRVVNVSVLPGQPTDGTGRVCIHLFVPDACGPFVEKHLLHREVTPEGQVVTTARPTRGRLACDPRRTVAPVTRGGVVTVTPRTNDPRATTCLKCLASKAYADMAAVIARAELGAGATATAEEQPKER